MKLEDRQLPVLLALLMSGVLIHHYVPKTMLKYVVVPIIKNKHKRVSDKDNYRPICLSYVFTKIVHKTLYNRMQSHQQTCNQLGFKPKHGTEMCIYVEGTPSILR